MVGMYIVGVPKRQDDRRGSKMSTTWPTECVLRLVVDHRDLEIARPENDCTSR